MAVQRERRAPLQPDELERTIRVDTEPPMATGAIVAAWLRMAPVGDGEDDG